MKEEESVSDKKSHTSSNKQAKPSTIMRSTVVIQKKNEQSALPAQSCSSKPTENKVQEPTENKNK